MFLHNVIKYPKKATDSPRMKTQLHIKLMSQQTWRSMATVILVANSLHLCFMPTRWHCTPAFSWQSLRPFMKSERPSSHHGKVTDSHSDTAAPYLHFSCIFCFSQIVVLLHLYKANVFRPW